MNTKQTKRFQPSIEALETRDLMSVTASLFGRTLLIRADNAGDNIVVDQKNGMISVSGTGGQQFNANSVLMINIAGGAGNDVIQLTNAVTKHANVVLGDGNATLLGGGGSLTAYCGAGNDVVVGGQVLNVEVGGTGHATLLRGQGWTEAINQRGTAVTDADLRIGSFQAASAGYLAALEDYWANYEKSHQGS